MLQSSLYRMKSGENISKLVDVICSSWIFNFIALAFFTRPLLYLYVPAKRYYTFLKLKSESWSQLNFSEFETSLYMRTLYWSTLHLFAVFLVHMITYPFNFLDFMSNSLYCLPYSLSDVSLKNLEFDQPVIL